MRWARVCVLPVPGPATMRRCPLSCTTARCWASLTSLLGSVCFMDDLRQKNVDVIVHLFNAQGPGLLGIGVRLGILLERFKMFGCHIRPQGVVGRHPVDLV